MQKWVAYFQSILPARSKAVAKALRWIFPAMVVIKLITVFLSPLLAQPDSYNYLVCIAHQDYPAGYPLMLRAVLRTFSSITAIQVVQTIVFCLAATFLLRAVVKTPKFAMVFAGLLAIEPASTMFANSLMSEALFVPQLLIWVTLLYYYLAGNKTFIYVIFLGVWIGFMYDVRFAAIFPALFVVGLLLWKETGVLAKVKAIVFFIIAFQCSTVPLRILSYKTFETVQLNGISGANWWNNSAFLYPGSETQKAPQTDFEHFLNNTDYSNTDAELSLNTRHLWSDSLPYRQFIAVRGYDFLTRHQASDLAGETGKELIMESPGIYLSEFVWPNFKGTLTEDDPIRYEALQAYLQEQYQYEGEFQESYPVWYWVNALVLAMLSLFVGATKKNATWYQVAVFAVLFMYGTLPILAAMPLRYGYAYIPVILCSLLVLQEKRRQEL